MTISSSGGLKKFFTIFWPERYGSDQEILIMMYHHEDGTPDNVLKFIPDDDYYFYYERLRRASTGKPNDYSSWKCSDDDSRYSFWILTDEGYDRLINERWRKSDPINSYADYEVLNASPILGRMGAEFELLVSQYGLIEEEDYFVDNKKMQISVTSSGRKKLGDQVI